MYLPGQPNPFVGTSFASAVVAAAASSITAAIPPSVPGYLFGLTLSTAGSSATFGIAAGTANNSTNVSLMTLSSAYTKTTSAWAVGTGNGALDTGAIANSTWYHVFLIQRPDTGVVDVLFSLSATSPTLPTNYTLFRRIGSMKTNGSALWTKFYQVGNDFLWDVPGSDMNTGTVSTTAVLITLSVPTGIQVIPNTDFFVNVSTVNTAVYLITSPEVPDTAPTTTPNNFTFITSINVFLPTAHPYLRTNTSGQIRARCNITTGGTFFATTMGWNDRRGQDS